jgi:hypothetical protein
VDLLEAGMALEPALKYRHIAQSFVSRDNH